MEDFGGVLMVLGILGVLVLVTIAGFQLHWLLGGMFSCIDLILLGRVLTELS